MKRHSLLTTVSVLAIPFVVLTGATPAIAEDDGCGGMNFFQCQVSRAIYAAEHIGQPQKSTEQPKAVLTVAPVAPTKDQLDGAASKINDLAITGIITADQAAQALKLVAAGGGNLVAAGGGNLVAAGGGNLVAAGGGNMISSDSASIVAANALSLAGASAQKAQISTALLSEGGNGLRAASQVVQQNMIVGFYDAGKITDTQAMALSKLVAAGGGNLVAAGGGNLVAAGGGNLVAAGGGNAISENGSGLVAAGGGNFALTGAAAKLVAAGGGNLISNGGTPLVAAGGGNLVAAGGGNLVAAGGGNLVAAGGGNLVAAGGGNLVSNAGGTLVSNAGGTLVAAGGGNLVAAGGGNLVAAGGGNIISDNSEGLLAKSGGNLASVSSLISEHGAGLVSAAGLSGARSVLDVGSSDKGQKVASLIESVTGPTPAQLAAQKAMADTQKAAADLTSAADLVRRDGLALQNAKAANDQAIIGQLQAKIDADNKAVIAAGIVLGGKSTLVAPGDVAAVQKLLTDSAASAKSNVDAGNAAANAAVAKPQPSQLQIDTANAAAATAATAAKAASDANTAVLALTKTLGTNPTNTADQLKVNNAMAASAVESAKAQLAKAQSDLVTMSKNGASAYDIKGQNDLIAKAQNNLNFQNAMVSNDYAAKAIAANTATADLATAKSVVDGLTKAYGSNRPSDPTQLATINAAMVVQALAQDKADQTAADTQRVRLIASGASASDIKTQADLIAVKQQDMANILKVNPTIVAAAGAAVNSDPALVQKAITSLVTTAATQSGTAVQLTSAQAQAALNAVAQLKAGATTTTTAATTAPSGAAADAAAMLNNLTKTASTYSIKSLSTDTAAKPTTTSTQVASTSPAVTAANPTTTQVANPATTSPATSAATAAATTTAPAPVAAPVDRSEMTPAVVQMLLGSGDSVITAMKAAQQAAMAKGDTAAADGLGKDIVNLQAQIAVAKTMPPPAATATTTAAAATTTTSPATTTTTNPTAAATSPTVVAATNPTSPATDAATTNAATSAGAATSTAKATDTPAPTKITTEQGKAVQQALRTVPGNLTKTEEKNLSTLSALVDRAATKGLTPDEAAQLKSGLAALAEKHPKAEKQIGLTKIANSVAVQKPVGEGGTKPVANSPDGKVAATTPPTSPVAGGAAKPGTGAPAEGKVSVTTSPSVPAHEANPAVAPKQANVAPAEGKTVMPAPSTSAALPGAKTTPAAMPSQASTKPAEHTAIAVPPTPGRTQEMKPSPVAPKTPEAHNGHNDMARLPPQPTPPKPSVVAAPPRPPAVATAAPKMPAAPAAKPQSCTPNMVNGKMMGMTCH